MLIPQVPLAADTPIDEAFITATTKLMVAGHVHLALEAGSAETLLPNLKPVLRTTKCRVGPFKASQADLATTYLDHGCLSVAFEVLAEDADADAVAASIGDIAEAVSTLPPSRVVIALRTPKHDAAAAAAGTPGHVATAPLLAAIASLKNLAAGFIVTVPNLHVPSDDIKALKAAAGGHAAICVTPAAGLAPLAAVEVGRLHRHDVSVIAPSLVTASNDDIATAEAAGKLDVGACIAACARSDRPDGLFTTVVSDECGKTLGLVYSSKDSIVEAVRCGRGVYYSRSRGGLWRKGDTSGAWQALKGIKLDCDSDALLFTVKQMGAIPAFCHLNTRNCWGEDAGLTALERTLAARLVDAPVGSYTKRLFDDPALLRHKLLEEAQELAEATEPDHVAAEAADVIYFALVACAKAGVSIADIEAHLDRRALKVRRRAGDSKPARIAAAKAHFEAVAAAKAATAAVATAGAASSAAAGSAVGGSGTGAAATGDAAAAAPAPASQ